MQKNWNVWVGLLLLYRSVGQTLIQRHLTTGVRIPPFPHNVPNASNWECGRAANALDCITKEPSIWVALSLFPPFANRWATTSPFLPFIRLV